MFIPAMLVGLTTILIIGLALGGITFLTAQHGMGINEGIAGVFYVLSGVIFPITILPGWAQAISKLLPVTYWMEAVRRGLSPEMMAALPGATGLEGLSDLQLVLTLLASAVVFLFVSLGVFKYADRTARRKGKIDWTTAY
jgi:ABC-2 type transport system permease protein